VSAVLVEEKLGPCGDSAAGPGFGNEPSLGIAAMTHARRAPCRWPLLGLAALALLGAGGCRAPKFYPVKGKVMFADTFKPVTEGEVRFQPLSRSGLVASGMIQPNGTFSLSTPDHGEGTLEGACRVAVIVPPRNDRPVIDPRYESFDTADLQFTVTARSENYFIIQVERAAR
jgi:hypothetical protein